MDDIVKAALQKWPNVPHCRGWLALDARGDWFLRDDQVQAEGPFPQSKGSRIEHDALRGFIGRNYAADDDGAWFFQNGPQRVYVELEVAPWIWRLSPAAGGAVTIASHTGRPAVMREVLLDERGRLFLLTDLGFGLVHSLDVGLAAEQVENGRWKEAVEVAAAELPARHGFVTSPVASAARTKA